MRAAHHRPDRGARLREGMRWLAEDSVRALRDWRPPEREEEAPAPQRGPRRRAPEPTWGRTTAAVAVRGTVQQRLLFPLLTTLGRPEVVGAHHLLAVRAPLVLAPNHASHADAPLVLQALPDDIRRRTVVPAAADYFFDRRALSVLVTLAMNAVPFDRRDEIADSVRRCERFLRHGYSVVLFPEGTRSRDGRLRGFKAGVAHLAVQTGAPVVPVFVQGTHALLPRGRAVPRPTAVAVHFGPALVAEADDTARRFNARLEAAVGELATAARGYAHRDREPERRSWTESWRSSARSASARERSGGDAPPTLPGAQADWIATWRSTTPR